MSTARKVTLQKGYILHSYPYRNSSMLIEVFTREYGRVGLVARGARSPKSRYHGILQPLRPLSLSWSGRGELYTLTEAETLHHQETGYREAVMCAFYMNELVLRLLHRHDPHEGLFDIYEKTLLDIGAVSNCDSRDSDQHISKVQMEQALRVFELQMLNELGYGLVLDHDADTGMPINAGADYDYFPEKGPVAAQLDNRHACRVSGSTLIDIAHGQLDSDKTRRQAKRLLHAIIDVLLEGKPLNTRVIYSDMMAMKNSRVTA